MGVNGFLISWATCLAISLQADSFSLLARIFLLASNLYNMLLYSFTRSPISSCAGQFMGSLFSKLVAFIFWVNNLNGVVNLLDTKYETIKKMMKIKTKILRMLLNTSTINSLSSVSDSKKGMAMIPKI